MSEDDMSSDTEVDTRIEINSKIVVVGDSGVGKTTFINRILDDMFKSCPESTIGAAVRTYLIKGKKFIFWDTAGQERFRSLIPLYYRSAHCIFLFYDMSDIRGQSEIPFWLDTIGEHVHPDVPVVIVGTKSDLEDSFELDFDDSTVKRAMKGINIVATLTISSKEESQQTLLNKFDEVFDKVYDYAKNNRTAVRRIVRINKPGYLDSVRDNAEYYTWGYCSLL